MCKFCAVPSHHTVEQAYMTFGLTVQEYVNELAQGLVDVDKNPQVIAASEKIKRLCNEAVSLCTRYHRH